MNQKLKAAAIAAVTDDKLDVGNPSYPNDPGVKTKGMCSRFQRCTTRKVYGSKYQNLFGGSAIITGRHFIDANMVVKTIEVGDFLIKMQGSGGFGHIEMFVGDVPGMGVNLTAGNSSSKLTHHVSGYKGYKTLSQFGAYDLIARLPVPEIEESVKSLYLNSSLICAMPIIEGSSWCPAFRWAELLGFDLDWDETDDHVIFNGKEVEAPTKLIAGRAYVAIGNLVSAAGLRILKNDQSKIVVGR